NVDGSEKIRLTDLDEWNNNPCFSPDGTKIAFSSNRDGNSEIYLMNTDGSEQINITNNPAPDFSPCFSPDGTKIVFISYPEPIYDYEVDEVDVPYEIYIMNIDGSNKTNISNTPDKDEYDPCFSPDGTKIAFSTYRDGNSEIYIMNADGSEQINITNNPDGNDMFQRFSP
ncbi:MAG: DUF5050 domain-containing protein, partial [Actinomycetota bacterium]|nr:DUF5050 domain-containing protein [Actinomycetota bacterium]